MGYIAYMAIKHKYKVIIYNLCHYLLHYL